MQNKIKAQKALKSRNEPKNPIKLLNVQVFKVHWTTIIEF